MITYKLSMINDVTDMEQTGTVRFRVIDYYNKPIGGAEIILNDQEAGITDSSGILMVGNIPIGSSLPYFVSAIGYNKPSGYINIMSTFQEQTITMFPAYP